MNHKEGSDSYTWRSKIKRTKTEREENVGPDVMAKLRCGVGRQTHVRAVWRA